MVPDRSMSSLMSLGKPVDGFTTEVSSSAFKDSLESTLSITCDLSAVCDACNVMPIRLGSALLMRY